LSSAIVLDAQEAEESNYRAMLFSRLSLLCDRGGGCDVPFVCQDSVTWRPERFLGKSCRSAHLSTLRRLTHVWYYGTTKKSYHVVNIDHSTSVDGKLSFDMSLEVKFTQRSWTASIRHFVYLRRNYMPFISLQAVPTVT